MATHSEVVQKFSQRIMNRRTNKVSWRGTNVYCEDRLLFSYGYHFILAIYLGIRHGDHFFLKNGDKYSVSTSGHQSLVQRACPGPTVSFTTLESAGIDPRKLTLENIIDYVQDDQQYIYWDKNNKKYYIDEYWYYHDKESFINNIQKTRKEFTLPKQGMFIKTGEYGDFSRGYWHILGGVLLKGNQNNQFSENENQNDQTEYYLCALDEGRYFISQLPRKARSVIHAFQILKPTPVKRAELNGLNVKRQGEWFFVATGMTNKELAQKYNMTQTALKVKSKRANLPTQDSHSNYHEAIIIKLNGKTYARGKVYHRNQWGKLSREHISLKLGEEWYLVYKNTEKASFSMGGNFD